MSKLKVFVSSNAYIQSGVKILQENFDVVQSKHSGFGSDVDEVRQEYKTLVNGVSAIVWLTKIRLDKDILDAAGPQLKIVAAVSAGTDHIDKEELKIRNIKLTNTPEVLNSSVAELAIGLMIGATRRFKEGFADLATGQWQLGHQEMLGQDIKGSTVGIVGLGGIGQSIVRKLQGFEVGKFVYTGHKEKPEGKKLGAEFLSLNELLQQSDFVVLACPLTSETNKLINAETLKKMKKTGVIINISRGGVIDQDVLIEALRANTIRAAGLDVTVPEPLPADNPLVNLQNCHMTPHIGSATISTRTQMTELAAKNVVLGLTGGVLLTPVL